MSDDAKPALSKESLRQYGVRIKKLQRNNIELDDVPAVFKFIKSLDIGVSAEKMYLSAIKHEMKDKFPKDYQLRINELYMKQNMAAKDQDLSEKQKDRYVDFDKLLEVQEMLANKKDKSAMEMRDYLIVSLYTLNAPVRADYGDMKIRKMNNVRIKENVLVFNKTPKFVFRNYKTEKTYGTVEIPVSEKLQTVLKEWFAYLGGMPEFIFQVKMSANALSSAVIDTFKRYTGKEVGISLIRHAYITKVYPTLNTIKQKEELARRMLHSKDTQEEYFLPTN